MRDNNAVHGDEPCNSSLPRRTNRSKVSISNILIQSLKWLLGTTAAALISAGAIWISSLFFPPSEELVCKAKEWFRPAAPGSQYTIILARLDRDPDGHQTAHVSNALSEIQDIVDIYRTCRTLRIEESAIQEQAQKTIQETASTLLHALNGDLLIWGETFYDENNKRLLSLRFVRQKTPNPNAYSAGLQAITTDIGQYRIQGIGLEEIFSEELKSQLHALVLSQVQPGTKSEAVHLVAFMKPIYTQITSNT